MKLLSKFVLAVLLLAPASFSWAACPEGYRNNYKGECVPTADSASLVSSDFLSSGSGWTFRRSLPVGAKKHGYQVVSAPNHPVRYGKTAERFEVRPGDCSRQHDKSWDDCTTDRERSELALVNSPPNPPNKNCAAPNSDGCQRQGDEYWYRWSIYIPGGHQNIFHTKLVYGQFHQFRIKPIGSCPPAFMFQEYGGGYWLNIQPVIMGYDDDYRLLEVDEFVGKWNEIVVHARWSGGKDGWFSVWVNGDQKVDYHGKTLGCDGAAGEDIASYFKYGIYRSFVSRSPKSKKVTTIAYYDGVVRSKSKEEMFDALPE